MKILITDDDPTSRKLLRALLAKAGHEVIECASGEELLELRQKGPLPPLLFLDWEMPGLQGPEVCRKLREESQSSVAPLYVILATGRSDRDDVREGLRAGANDYIFKPFKDSEVLSRLEIALRAVELTETVVRQRAQLAARSRMAMLGEMADGMAHEINNPLSIMQMRTEKIRQALESGKFAPEALLQDIDPIFRLISKVSGIIQSLRAFACDSDEEAVRSAPVQDLLDSSISFIRARAEREGVKLEVRVDDSSAEVECRAQQLTEAILSLVTNALQAVDGRKEKRISVEAKTDGGRLELAVTDTGAGIAPEHREKIMQPFFTTRPVGQGTGLGLSVALGIAQAHGGELRLDSASAKTRFVLTVPLKQAKRGALAA